jgi:ferrous iron transport protein B
MVEFNSTAQTAQVLVGIGGWTLLTGINLMLFSLMHNPCSTTILTIYRETKSLKWTVVATVLPIVMGVTTTTTITWIARALKLV